MKRLLYEAAFVFLAWLIPFAVSVCVFSLKRSHAPLFESLMGIALVTSTVVLGCVYLGQRQGRLFPTALRIGLTWMVANWALDALMFSSGPMKMSVHQYVNEIAGAYLMIPVITVGLGIAATRARRAPPQP